MKKTKHVYPRGIRLRAKRITPIEDAGFVKMSRCTAAIGHSLDWDGKSIGIRLTPANALKLATALLVVLHKQPDELVLTAYRQGKLHDGYQVTLLGKMQEP